MSDDDVDAKSDKLGRNLTSTVAAPAGIADLERDIPAFRIAKVLQTTSESVGERMRRRCGHQHADERQFSLLLRAPRERPKKRRHGRRAAEQRYERASPHSITSSATSRMSRLSEAHRVRSVR